ncbi:hypothetical protein HYPSUDRAFT_200338 [Hypholoma sublateritium FD-334 SS-4]|uniref:Uncharacterized protein n=1 Tax=Hypholoma sublateritium (strain FD-334 SS-4) TaxID=945553 RepID=A0A0D2PZM4_HYPSF|nr:hypothetical protein HYPSUDRAFT_200338 [Hypholoma sublateritium FD-334 SS-4]
MEVYTPSAPIYGVNNDVLLFIFTLNADMFFDSQALHTARATSQVCRQWRDLMLEAPLLWSKLIDMDICNNDGKLGWITEIIRRSGTVAPLWIKAEVNGRSRWRSDTDNIKQFFMDLLSNNWYRIQKLVVFQDRYSGLWFNLTFPMLCFPAPQLERFTILRTDGYSYKRSPATESIFSTHAPMLRTFRLPGYAVHQEPWIRHLHTMLLDSAYGIREALTVLSAMNCLQELEINNITYGDIATSLPIAALPHLKYLKFDGEPTQNYAMLLDHMTIPVGCSLDFRVSYPHDHPRNAERMLKIERVFEVFIRRAEGYLESHKFDTFHLDYKPHDRLTLKLGGKPPVECMLSISIPLHQDLVPMSLRRINYADLANITTFQLHTEGALPRSFRLFFQEFPSVHTIHTDDLSFHHLSTFQRSINATRKSFATFPRLKVIRVSISDDTRVFNLDKEFFLSRFENGHPIEMLDISNGLPFTSPPDLDAIEAVKGLKVRYKLPQTQEVFEHTCGGRDPANQCGVSDSGGREVWVECGSLQVYELWIEAGNL